MTKQPFCTARKNLRAVEEKCGAVNMTRTKMRAVKEKYYSAAKMARTKMCAGKMQIVRDGTY